MLVVVESVILDKVELSKLEGVILIFHLIFEL